MDWSLAWIGRGETVTPNLASLMIPSKSLGATDMGNSVEAPTLRAILSLGLCALFWSLSGARVHLHSKTTPCCSHPSAGCTPLKCCCWWGSHSTQTVRPTWKKVNFCVLNHVPHHLAVSIAQLYVQLDLMSVFFWFATHWNREPVRMIGPVLGFKPCCTGLPTSTKFRVISKKCLEDHRTKAPFSKVALALRRLLSKPRNLIPAKYGFRKQVGWSVKSLKNRRKIYLSGQFIKKGVQVPGNSKSFGNPLLPLSVTLTSLERFFSLVTPEEVSQHVEY